MASFHMEEALVWIQDKEELGLFTSQEAFVKALQTQLGSTAYDDKMKALARLRQTSAVANYKEQFKALFNQIKGLSKGHKLSCFLSGLKDGSVATCQDDESSFIKRHFGPCQNFLCTKKAIKAPQDSGKPPI